MSLAKPNNVIDIIILMYASYLIFSHSPILLQGNGCNMNCSMDVKYMFSSPPLPWRINTMIMQSVIVLIAITCQYPLRNIMQCSSLPEMTRFRRLCQTGSCTAGCCQYSEADCWCAATSDGRQQLHLRVIKAEDDLQGYVCVR